RSHSVREYAARRRSPQFLLRSRAPQAWRSYPRRFLSHPSGVPSPKSDDRCELANELRIVVQRRWPLEVHAKLARDALCIDVDVVKNLDMVTYESDRNTHHVAYSARSERREVVGIRGPKPWLRTPAGGLVAPRPLTGRNARAVRHELRRFVNLRVVRISCANDSLGKTVRAEDDMHRIALRLRPACDAGTHAIRESAYQAGRCVITVDVCEINGRAVHREAIGDLCLIPRYAHAAEVWRENHAHRAVDSVHAHPADGFFDPWRPVSHSYIYAKARRRTGGIEHALDPIGLALRQLGDR